MSYVPVKLHDSSLRLMKGVLCFLLVLPSRPHFKQKLLYNGCLLIYLALITRWRFAFNYTVSYDPLHDNFSIFIDLVNFVALVIGHGIVSMELLWRNRTTKIEQQILQIHNILREKIGRKINRRYIQLYSIVIFVFLFIRVTVVLGLTIYNNVKLNESLLLICNFYSEVVLIVRCCEFTLHSALVLEIYQELHDAATDLRFELESKHFKNWSPLPLQRLATIQHLHQQLWRTQRNIESNFGRSLIIVMMKYFLDTSVLPYWAYTNRIYVDNVAMQLWCAAEELGKVFEICLPCWFCTRCDYVQRKFRSVFHGISTDRHNDQLNTALLRISAQLGQETCQFRIGGLITINNDMLGKFLFGMLTYIFICVQFRITFTVKETDVVAEPTVSSDL